MMRIPLASASGNTALVGVGRFSRRRAGFATTTLVPGRLAILPRMVAILMTAARTAKSLGFRLVLAHVIDPAAALCSSCSA
jgi:hypothetical protein